MAWPAACRTATLPGSPSCWPPRSSWPPACLKLPSLAGPAGAHIHGQVLVGALVAGLASYLSVKWLTCYFETRTLIPFAIYSLLAGAICIIRFA